MVQQSEKNKLIKKMIWEKFSKSTEEHQTNISKAKELPSLILCSLINNEELYKILLMFGELYWRMSDDEIWFKCFKQYLDEWNGKYRD